MSSSPQPDAASQGSSGSTAIAAASSNDAAAAGAKHEMSKEQSQFWEPAVAETRKSTLKQLLMGITLVTLVLWIALPVFWGSNYLLTRYLSRLTVLAVNFEGADGAVGPLITEMAAQTNVQTMRPHLGFIIRPASDFPNGVEDVKQAVGYSHYWGAVVAYPNCTTTWQSSLATGNASYDPTGCIGVFYSGARFYQVTLLYLSPLMKTFSNTIAQMASQQALQQWLTANGGNAAALATASAVPQAFATPFSLHQNDLRPITHWAVAAPFEAALIYYLILGFLVAMWGNAARQKSGWNQRLTFPSLVAWRIGVPCLVYAWLSLMFSLLFRAFLIPTDAAFGSAGFVVLWVLNFLTLAACGLALESMLALLTAEYLPFILILLIISNITSSFQPIEAMEKFYRFLRIMPFYHATNGYKIITHATRENHKIGINFGALIAFIAVDLLGFVPFLALERRREEKNMPDKKIIYS